MKSRKILVYSCDWFRT